MFGLMRAKKCGMTAEEREVRRLNYCGTCKTIGSLYGQKSRFLLNHDTVFLAEVLSALSGENAAGRGSAYQSYNCLSLPESELPFSLQYAATANVILTEFKLADHVADEGKRRYKIARRAFSGEFRTAGRLLEKWNFPLGEVKAILDSQSARERSEKSLDALAWPTAETTGIFFREGVRRCGAAEIENLAFELGFAFGKLVYLVDAFEDYERDLRAGKFNAFRAAFDLREAKLTPGTKRRISALLRRIESEIAEKIALLPIAENRKTLFISRLSQNLQRKLKTDLPVLKTSKSRAPEPRPIFRQRWQAASAKAGKLARQYRWQMPLVFLFVFVFALVAPAHSREAKSARECFDLSFNLMTLGAIFGSVLTISPLKMVAINHKRKKKKEGGEGGEGGEDSGESCCDCECCCDCDGCTGCCDGCGDCDCGCCGDGCCCDCSCD
jgi:hypothetical protein